MLERLRRIHGDSVQVRQLARAIAFVRKTYTEARTVYYGCNDSASARRRHGVEVGLLEGVLHVLDR